MGTYKGDSAAASQTWRFMGMGGDPRPRMRGDEPKLAPNGKPTFSTGVVAAREDGGQDRGVTVAVTEPGSYPMGTVLRPDGAVWITPYVLEGGSRPSVGISIVAERLVPIDSPAQGSTKTAGA